MKITINCLNIALNSSSHNVERISNTSYFGTYSIIGRNIRFLIQRTDMNVECSEIKTGMNEELVRVCEVIVIVIPIL